MCASLSSIESMTSFEQSDDSSEIQNSILVGDYDFFGPYVTSEEILEQPGLLALLIEDGKEYELLEMMASNNLRKTAEIELDLHSENLANIAIAVFYAAGSSLKEVTLIKDKLLRDFDFAEDGN